MVPCTVSCVLRRYMSGVLFRGFAALLEDFHGLPQVEHLHDKLLNAWLVYEVVLQLQKMIGTDCRRWNFLSKDIVVIFEVRCCSLIEILCQKSLLCHVQFLPGGCV